MPKSPLDWLGLVCAWVGSIVLAIRSAGAPLLPGAPTILAANFWNFVPAVLLSIALLIFIYRQLLPADTIDQAEIIKQQRLAAKEARVATGPLAAPALIPPQRRLTESEKSAITRHAIGYQESGDAPKQLNIFHNTASRNAIRCATDLVEAFGQAKWNVMEGGGTGHQVFPPSGIGLAFYDYGDLAPDQRIVKEALELAGIPFDIISPERFMLARTIIFVTDPD